MIGLTVHHVDGRKTCSGCRTRVFTFADELDDGNMPAAFVFSVRPGVARGEPVCRICGERIDETVAGWRHVNQQRRHLAAPLITI